MIKEFFTNWSQKRYLKRYNKCSCFVKGIIDDILNNPEKWSRSLGLLNKAEEVYIDLDFMHDFATIEGVNLSYDESRLLYEVADDKRRELMEALKVKKETERMKSVVEKYSKLGCP